MPARPPLGSSPWALAGGDCWVRSLFTGFVVFVFPSRWLPDRRSPRSTSPSQTLTSPPPLPFLNPLLHTLPVPHPYPTRPDPTRPDPTRPDPTLPYPALLLRYPYDTPPLPVPYPACVCSWCMFCQVSSCSGTLDHIVVETAEGATACVEYLRK